MKNYIEEFLKDNGLKINVPYELSGGLHNPYEFNQAKQLLDCRGEYAFYETICLLNGTYKIEKIKPKTLIKQLKEQGYCFFIVYSSTVHNYIIQKINIFKLGDSVSEDFFYDNDEAFVKHCEMGFLFLTKSEAERELYRRKLEFEMQEWARENDCLSGNDCLNPYEQVFNGLNVYVKKDYIQDMRSAFGGKYDVWINYLL